MRTAWNRRWRTWTACRKTCRAGCSTFRRREESKGGFGSGWRTFAGGGGGPERRRKNGQRMRLQIDQKTNRKKGRKHLIELERGPADICTPASTCFYGDQFKPGCE